MASLDEIVSFCDELLDCEAFDDYGPNGLQVPGGRDVRKLVTCVSASRELLERAESAAADLVVAHHGLFWDFHPRALTPTMAERLRILLSADIALCGYHLPLDAHPDVGNNALLCRALGFEPSRPFAPVKGREIGVVGRSQDAVPADELRGRIAALLGREPFSFDAGPAEIETIGVVTGAGSSALAEAIADGLDALITGEPAEHAMADAREGGIHFIAAGHYATETLGVRRLGELVAERFGIDQEFVDVPNPI